MTTRIKDNTDEIHGRKLSQGSGVILNGNQRSSQPPMPPRLSKRQQREQEEIAALASTTKPVEDSQASSQTAPREPESDDAPVPISKRPVGQSSAGFSIVGVLRDFGNRWARQASAFRCSLSPKAVDDDTVAQYVKPT